MNILAISINHKTAPVEVREAVYLSNEEIKNLTSSIKNSLFTEGLIVTTCNRTEIYGIPANQNLSHEEIQNALLNFKSVSGLKPEHFQYLSSANAIKHLFSVATGIDSLLIGDNQIFKQVKDSFQTAEDLNFTGFLMKRIFDSAVKAGRRAISETGISEGAVTVSYAAVQLIEKIFSNLSKKSALVIGAGETGEIAAKHLRERGIGNLTITNRTYERAEKLAESLSAKILPFTNFKDSLHEFDIVLSATSSDSLILTKADVLAAMKKRNYNSLILMDIAIPRDIDPESKSIDYVFYNDIDSLNIIVQQNLIKRKEEIPKVEKIIEEELNTFLNWFNSLEVAPTIKDLRDYFEAIRLDEIEKNKNRFSPEDQEKLEIITKRIINKILHHPTVELKKYTESGVNSDEAAQKVSIVRELFGMTKNDEKEDKREK
ncbi:MAG TPA: glutamyl-tRNA reductase [Ignavibacteriaceae bacterium]|nr:glutamyl-tRNA reductase [Ignavibacteriaceae bacterium]